MSSFQNAARVSHADRPASRLRPVAPHAVLLAVTLGTLALSAPPAAAALESTASDAAHIEASPLVTAHARTGAEAVPLGSAERTSLLVCAADDRAGVRRAVRAGSREDRVAKDVMKDADGTVHIRYTRTYQGRPVEGGGDLIVHDGPHGRQIDDSPHLAYTTADNFARRLVWAAPAPRGWPTTTLSTESGRTLRPAACTSSSTPRPAVGSPPGTR